MAQFRPPPAAPDRQQTSRDLAGALAEPAARTPADMRALIREAGGTRAAARMVGRSERTLRRWAADQVRHVPDQARGALARAGQAHRTRELITALGGAQRVADMTGRSLRTVQRWASGQITRPRTDARRALGRADTAVRMRGKGLHIDPATGRPTSPIYVQLTGAVRINAAGKGYSYPSRAIGTGGLTPQGFEIPAEVMETVVDALSHGDLRGAHHALEAYLSVNYAAAGSYNPAQNTGLFIDRIDTIRFSQ